MKLKKVFGSAQAIKALFVLLSSPFHPEKVIVSCYSSDLGKYIYLRPARSDMFVLGQVFIQEEFDYDIDFTPDLIIDGGAHCGFATLYFLNRFPDTRVVAIEPEKSNFSILKKNVGDIEKVTLINKPLASKEKNVSLSNPGAKSPSFRYKESKSAEGQETITILQVLDQYSDNFNHGILKLDIEGAEKEIFKSYPEDWIDDFELIFVEPHDWIYSGIKEIIMSVCKDCNKMVDKIGENMIIK
jgi:FkbM family methyltransferase